MKKLVSLLLSLVLVSFSVVTAFAAEEANFTQRYNQFKKYVDDCEEYYIYYYRILPNPFAIWSDSSTQRMKDAIADARGRTLTTVEDVEVAYSDFEAVVSTMCLDKSNFKFMIYLFEKETNINGYYDEQTWNNFQELLNKGKQAYESDDEEFIHKTYLEMRDAFNNLCSYNTLKGDLNGDGILSVLDATLGQKYLADLVEFNSSQRTLMLMEYGASVSSVTSIQKVIVGRQSELECDALDDLLEYEGLDLNARRLLYIDETVNSVYYDDYYDYRFGYTYS